MQLKIAFFLSFSLFFCPILRGQVKQSEKQMDKRPEKEANLPVDTPRSYLKIYGSYASQLAYWGRTDSVTQSSTTPALAFHDARGFNAYFETSFWSAAQKKPAFSNLGLGWDFDLGKNWLLSVNYDRWIFHEDKTANNVFSAALAIKPYDWEISVAPFLIAGADKSYGGDIDISKSFYVNNFSIAPEITASYATSSTSTPIRTSNVKRTPRGRPVVVTTTTTVTTVSPLRILNYEFILPISYEIENKWSITAAYHYNLPKNGTKEEGVLKPLSLFSLDFEWYLWSKEKPKN